MTSSVTCQATISSRSERPTAWKFQPIVTPQNFVESSGNKSATTSEAIDVMLSNGSDVQTDTDRKPSTFFRPWEAPTPLLQPIRAFLMSRELQVSAYAGYPLFCVPNDLDTSLPQHTPSLSPWMAPTLPPPPLAFPQYFTGRMFP